jgi:hypothetical protein
VKKRNYEAYCRKAMLGVLADPELRARMDDGMRQTTLADINRLVDREWAADSQGHEYLDFSRFCLSWFQLADIWADAITPASYIHFLEGMIARICRVDARGDLRFLSDDLCNPELVQAHKNMSVHAKNPRKNSRKKSKSSAAISGAMKPTARHSQTQDRDARAERDRLLALARKEAEDAAVAAARAAAMAQGGSGGGRGGEGGMPGSRWRGLPAATRRPSTSDHTNALLDKQLNAIADDRWHYWWNKGYTRPDPVFQHGSVEALAALAEQLPETIETRRSVVVKVRPQTSPQLGSQPGSRGTGPSRGFSRGTVGGRGAMSRERRFDPNPMRAGDKDYKVIGGLPMGVKGVKGDQGRRGRGGGREGDFADGDWEGDWEGDWGGDWGGDGEGNGDDSGVQGQLSFVMGGTPAPFANYRNEIVYKRPFVKKPRRRGEAQGRGGGRGGGGGMDSRVFDSRAEYSALKQRGRQKETRGSSRGNRRGGGGHPWHGVSTSSLDSGSLRTRSAHSGLLASGPSIDLEDSISTRRIHGHA